MGVGGVGSDVGGVDGAMALAVSMAMGGILLVARALMAF